MFKYMKYEIKGSYKYIMGILALVLILFTGIYSYTNRVSETTVIGNIFISLSVLVLFGTALATFLYIVGSFRKELYEDRGYLTFTLPLTGNQIVGSKLIVALLWFFVLGVAIAIYNVIMILIFTPVELNLAQLFPIIAQSLSIKGMILATLTTIFSTANMLIIIYFSMALSRVTFRNKRIGSLWFIIFIILSGILAYGQLRISELLPYYLDINTFKVGTMDTLNHQINVGVNNGIEVSTNLGIVKTNIASNIYMILTTIVLFLGTGYLIEKKIDL